MHRQDALIATVSCGAPLRRPDRHRAPRRSVLAGLAVLAAVALGSATSPAFAESGEVYDRNDHGQSVGYVSTGTGQDTRAAQWQDGKLTELATLGGSHSYAYDINNRGQTIGVAFTPDGQGHAVLWQPDGTLITLGTLGGIYSSASHINDLGQVIGYSLTADGQRHAFAWQDGAMTDLSAAVGGDVTVSGINELGQVTGETRGSNGQSQAFIAELTSAAPTLGGGPGTGNAVGNPNTGNNGNTRSNGNAGGNAGGNGNAGGAGGNPIGGSYGGVNPAATPELGSLALFGSGALGMAGYALTRLRAGRRRP